MIQRDNKISADEEKALLKNDWDKKLKIHTTGRDDSNADAYHHPYEPTPYEVLERLVESEYISSDSKLIDYGCGKGRVGFFLHHQLGCRVLGLEYDERIYHQALENLDSYGNCSDISFECQNAAEYEISDADCFYFFNPFSVEILHSVMARILESYYENPRETKLFFYYPDDEYVSYLMSRDEVMFVDEIDCQDLCKGDSKRERILVFEI